MKKIEHTNLFATKYMWDYFDSVPIIHYYQVTGEDEITLSLRIASIQSLSSIGFISDSFRIIFNDYFKEHN